MAIITKSIGTSSKDYSTIIAWEADLDDTGVYSSGDDAVGECYNDSVFDESVTINGGETIGLNSVTLTVADGEESDGTAGSGARIVLSSEGSLTATSPNATIEKLELDANGNAFGVRAFGSSDYTFKQLIVHGLNGRNDFNSVQGTVSAKEDNFTAINCIVYDVEETGDFNEAFAFYQSGYGNHYLYNNTAHDIRYSGPAGDGAWCYSGNAGGFDEVKNCIGTAPSTSNGTAACFGNDLHTESHNLSSDGTAAGTGSLTNEAAADQFVSTISGSEDLHLKSGSNAIDAGTDLSAEMDAVDITGETRPQGSAWDIGAFEYVSSGGITWNIGGVSGVTNVSGVDDPTEIGGVS